MHRASRLLRSFRHHRIEMDFCSFYIIAQQCGDFNSLLGMRRYKEKSPPHACSRTRRQGIYVSSAAFLTAISSAAYHCSCISGFPPGFITFHACFRFPAGCLPGRLHRNCGSQRQKQSEHRRESAKFPPLRIFLFQIVPGLIIQ